MPSFNRVVLAGHITRDIELRYTPGGTAVADISLAMNRHRVDKNTNQKVEEVTFVDVTLWGRTAEICNEYSGKGKPVLIEGRLQQDRWEDRDTGQKRSKLKVVAENLQLLGGRGESGGNTAPANTAPRETTQNADQLYFQEEPSEVPF